MSAADAFKPAGGVGGGKEIAVVNGAPQQGSELGAHFRTQQQATQVGQPPMKVGQGGAAFVPAGGGAPVALGAGQPATAPPLDISKAPKPGAGPPVPRADAFQPAVTQPQMGAPTPQPLPQRAAPQAQMGGTEKYAVYIDGVGPDGAALTTEPIVTEFPAGSTLSGMRYDRITD